MTEETRPTEPTGVPGDGAAPAAPKLTRRRFTKAGVVAPVIMTLASRPVWGQCMTLSGIQSGNTSDAADSSKYLPPGEGHSADYWRSHPDLWPVQLTSAQYTICGGSQAGQSVTIYEPDSDGIWSGLISGDEYSREAAAAKLNVIEFQEAFYDPVEAIGDILATNHENLDDVTSFLACLNSRTEEVDFSVASVLDIEVVKPVGGDGTSCFDVISIDFSMIGGTTIFGVGEVGVASSECTRCSTTTTPTVEPVPLPDANSSGNKDKLPNKKDKLPKK